jgi:ferredoxin-type protein NapH
MSHILNLRVSKNGDLHLPVVVFMLTASLLAVVQIKLTNNPLILLERFIPGAGWIEIAAVALYGAFMVFKMQSPDEVPKWRRISWTIFSVVFFTQLALGLLGAEKFLMTGKLHLPIPVMIVSGPLYRGELSIMTILFLSTIILTGPAWCSQLCYFGAFDNLASTGKTERGKVKNKGAIKTTLIFLIIAGTLLLRWFNVPILTATLVAAGFGVTGIAIMIFFSRRRRKMIHCTLWCPIGTIVSVLKPVNPFRLYIDNSCDLCNKCTSYCKYDALNIQDIRNKKPDYSCTLCGDCLTACPHSSIKYGFFKMQPDNARKLWLVLTITLHAVFLALARI